MFSTVTLAGLVVESHACEFPRLKPSLLDSMGYTTLAVCFWDVLAEDVCDFYISQTPLRADLTNEYLINLNFTRPMMRNRSF